MIRRLSQLQILVMDAIANDYEDVGTVIDEVTQWAKQIGQDVSSEAIRLTLIELVRSGLAGAYVLSPTAPPSPVNELDDQVYICHFLLTEDGQATLIQQSSGD